MAVKNVELDLKRIAAKTKRKMETFVHEFTQDMAEEVVKRTPGPGNTVRTNPPPGEPTGFLRGSWFVSLNSTGAAFEGTQDKSGANTIARMSVSIAGSKVGDTIHVLNGANYAGYVENGTSRMAPRLFVASTVNDAPQIANRTAARIAKK